MLGVTAGPIDSAAALRDARAMLGRGTRESGGGAPRRGTGEGTLGAFVCLVGDPPPGLPAPRRPPAARAPRPGQQPQHGQHPPAATASSEEGALLGRLLDLLESRSGRGESRAELFGLGAGAVGSADDYEAAAGSLLRVAGACGILGLERIVATRRAHPEVVVATNDRVTREGAGTAAGRVAVRAAARPRTAHPASRKLCHSDADGDHDRGRSRRGPAARIRAPARPILAHVPCYRIRPPSQRHTTSSLGGRCWDYPTRVGVARPRLAPIKSAGLAAFHRDRSALDVRRARGRWGRRGSGGGTSSRRSGTVLDEHRPGAVAKAAVRAAEQAKKQQQDGGKGSGGRGSGGAASTSG